MFVFNTVQNSALPHHSHLPSGTILDEPVRQSTRRSPTSLHEGLGNISTSHFAVTEGNVLECITATFLSDMDVMILYAAVVDKRY